LRVIWPSGPFAPVAPVRRLRPGFGLTPLPRHLFPNVSPTPSPPLFASSPLPGITSTYFFWTLCVFVSLPFCNFYGPLLAPVWWWFCLYRKFWRRSLLFFAFPRDFLLLPLDPLSCFSVMPVHFRPSDVASRRGTQAPSAPGVAAPLIPRLVFLTTFLRLFFVLRPRFLLYPGSLLYSPLQPLRPASAFRVFVFSPWNAFLIGKLYLLCRLTFGPRSAGLWQLVLRSFRDGQDPWREFLRPRRYPPPPLSLCSRCGPPPLNRAARFVFFGFSVGVCSMSFYGVASPF